MPNVDPYLLAAICGLVLLAALIGVGVGFLVVRTASRAKGASPVAGVAQSYQESDQVRGAEARAQEILEQARQDADRVLKDAELKTRDEAFRRREELTRELEAAR